MDFKVGLQVGSSTTKVDVSAEAPLVEDTKSGVTATVGSDQIDSLPINGRRVDSFVLLTPAVTNDGEFGLISFRGIAAGNAFLTDGNDTTNSFYNENAGRTRIGSQLSQDAVYQAKRFLLDSVGCALGGYQQHDVKIALEVLDEIAGRGPATVIGTNKRIDAVSASLANALMIRCMDYNDIYWKQDPSHPSDIFPAALACCERAKTDGRELIVGLVLGHEFEMRFCEAAFPGIRERGWHHATLTAFVSPIQTGLELIPRAAS